jgi:16S rRNA (cytosine967-C5)-methyltransferase
LSRPRQGAGRPDRRPPAPLPAGQAARTVAADIYADIVDRRLSLDHLIDPAGGNATYRGLAPRDRRFVRALVATTIRRQNSIAFALGKLIAKRPPSSSGRLRFILDIAAAQLLFMGVPDHAVVSVALDQLDADRDARHFKGLANAVLRRLAREKETILAGLDDERTETPVWLWERWSAAYGEPTARLIAIAHLHEAGLDLTVKTDPEAWAERLGGIVLPTGSIRLAPSGPIDELAGFADGEWWVQDAAAALPAKLVGDVSGKRLLDLCAAPGGKTAQLAAAGGTVTALDISAQRLTRLEANLKRLNLTAETVAADVFEWTPSGTFDAVLLDAPCSATGTIRRHPDIARLKRPEDVTALTALQERMVDKAVAFLKPGGTLVYCTCSLEHEEGEAQFSRALSRHNLALLPIGAEEVGGLTEILHETGTVRTLPCHLPSDRPRMSGLDGFFIGRCQKP